MVSSFSTALPPTKPPRRRNRLRQKILKTLKEPIIPQLPPLNPITPVKILLLQESEESGAIQETEESDKPVNEEVQKLEELREEEVSASAASLDGNVGILRKNQILKYGLWLVGAFVFQTVCAIWVFGSGGMDNENEILNGTEKNSLLEGDGNEKMGVRNSADSLIYVDELEMERKIEEIRVMAREAREKERLESKRKGLDSEDREGTDGGKYPKSGIEEEVDNRLIKLRKKLKNARDRMPVASVGYSKKDNTRTDGVETGELDESESNGALLFKKKYKFKGLSGDIVEKPKGFIGSDDTRVKSGSSEKGDELIKSVNGDNDTVGLGDAVKRTDMLDVDPKGSDAVRVVEEDKKKSTSEMTESTRNTRKKVAKVKGISKQVKGKSRETKGDRW